MKLLTKAFLWISIGIGLYGAVSLSYVTIKGTDTCPSIGFTRACYAVAIAYILMALSLFVRNRIGTLSLFGTGWVIAFGFAAFGSVTEAISGDVCPAATAGFPLYAVPMCYVSLGLCLVIISTWFTRLKWNE